MKDRFTAASAVAVLLIALVAPSAQAFSLSEFWKQPSHGPTKIVPKKPWYNEDDHFLQRWHGMR